MSILALDISSTRTGWSVMGFDGVLIKFGTVCPPKNMVLAEKLHMFRQNLLEILQEYKPTNVIIEDVYIRHIQSAVVLARFSGVAIETVFSCGVIPVLMTVTGARRVVGQTAGKPLRDKKAVFEFIKIKYSLKNFVFSDHNDITDSILLGLAVINGRTGGETKNPSESKDIDGRPSKGSAKKKSKGHTGK